MDLKVLIFDDYSYNQENFFQKVGTNP